MSVESIDGTLGALGLSLKNLIAGAIISFAALSFFDGQKMPDGSVRPRSAWHRWTTFMGGWALSAWGGPPLNAWLELPPKIEIGIVLVLGLFGMASASEIFKFIRDGGWRAYLPKRGGGQ